MLTDGQSVGKEPAVHAGERNRHGIEEATMTQQDNQAGGSSGAADRGDRAGEHRGGGAGGHRGGHREPGGEFEGVLGLVAGWAMGVGRGRSARLIVDLARVGPGDRVVDVGCGPGLFLRAAAERGATAVGVDPSAQMRRLATRRTDRQRAAVTVVDGTAERLPLDDASATAAWAVASFHHWADPDAGLAELYRVLGPGGRFLVAERLARPRGWFRHHALTRPAADALAARAERTGFDGVTVASHRVGRRQLVVVAGRRPAGPS
jgi:SAM-dependent methyltransferase